ncbi:DNA polymerase III subunit beta [Mycoplasmopsis opalescens]|uniref:DNA polymerase III subunit beta n=1 Tax=Mycoplasmopsis opalescens TaxID=114886 RepID=UPI0004A720A4|nr:DNA polymerase III subunit beta [Mycoplasmopsis opalescens]
MKFQIQKNILDQVLETVSKYTDPINSFYALRCILIRVEREKIYFFGKSEITSIIKNVDVDDTNVIVEETGEFLINASLFKNAVKKLNDLITIKLNYNQLEIKQGSSFYSLHTSPATNFPILDINILKKTKQITINREEFKKAIKNVIFAVSTENNLIYKAINVILKKNKLIFNATDTFRLAHTSIKVSNPNDYEFNLSILGRELKDLIPLEADENINLFFDEMRFGITYKNTIIYARVIDIPYNNVETLFTNFVTKYKIETTKEAIMDTINKVYLQFGEKQVRIEFKFKSNEMECNYRLDEIGTSQAKTTEISLDGSPFELDLNYNFVKDALSVFTGKIIMLVDEKCRKILFLSRENEATKQLITPLNK